MNKTEKIKRIFATMKLYNITLLDLEKASNGQWPVEHREEYKTEDRCFCDPPCKVGYCNNKNIPYDGWWG